MTNNAPAASDENAIRELLRRVVDPELGENIVELGLVYRIESAPGRLRVDMTMTSQACPMGEMIVDEARAALAAGLPGCEVEVQLVWEPEWQPSMMSAAARDRFGW